MKWFVLGFFMLGLGLLIYNNLPGSRAPNPPPIDPDTQPDSPPENPDSPPEKRIMTYYSAKAALARLQLYLREEGNPPIKGVWQATAERSAVYEIHSSLYRTVGGWSFLFTDTSGKSRYARLNCWGEVNISDLSTTDSTSFLRMNGVDEIVLDNIDANSIVLNYGGEAKSDAPGGWFMAADVEGRGIRPVWGGNEWFIRKDVTTVMVDAQTGEIYRPSLTGENRLQPLVVGPRLQLADWNGGFDPNSDEAIMGKSEHYYWWPRAYQGSERQYVYNRKLLRQNIQTEEIRMNRDEKSWITTGILHNALGEWAQGVDDLRRAEKINPQNAEIHFDLSVAYLIIRDLKHARLELDMLSTSDKRRTSGTALLDIFNGDKQSNGLIEQMDNIDTNDGMIPLVTLVGPRPLAAFAPQHERGAAN